MSQPLISKVQENVWPVTEHPLPTTVQTALGRWPEQDKKSPSVQKRPTQGQEVALHSVIMESMFQTFKPFAHRSGCLRSAILSDKHHCFEMSSVLSSIISAAMKISF